MAKLITPPITHPSKLMLKAVVLSNAWIKIDTNAGPKPLPRSSIIPRNEFARPRELGTVTLVRIARSIGTGITAKNPANKETVATTATDDSPFTQLMRKYIGRQLTKSDDPIINAGKRGSFLYAKCPKHPLAITPSAFPAPNVTKTPVASCSRSHGVCVRVSNQARGQNHNVNAPLLSCRDLRPNSR